MRTLRQVGFERCSPRPADPGVGHLLTGGHFLCPVLALASRFAGRYAQTWPAASGAGSAGQLPGYHRAYAILCCQEAGAGLSVTSRGEALVAASRQERLFLVRATTHRQEEGTGGKAQEAIARRSVCSFIRAAPGEWRLKSGGGSSELWGPGNPCPRNGVRRRRGTSGCNC